MKRILILQSCFLLLVSIILVRCNNSKATEADKKTEPDIEFKSNQAIQATTDKSLSPTATIYVKKAKEMVDYYYQLPRYLQFFNRNNNLVWDSRCAWFSKEVLDTLRKILECEKGDGVRIYYGVYNSKADDGDYYRYKTVIFTTTYDSTVDGKKYHRDNLSDTCEVKRRFYDDLNSNKMLPTNHGSLCPPPDGQCFNGGALLLSSGQ